MKVGIMQPYFLPYIGYWQLMNAVDRYVIYDDVNFIKGGWINRNRILVNGQVKYFNVPMLGASSFKRINEIYVNHDVNIIQKELRTLENAYGKAPYFNEIYPMMVKILLCGEDRLSDYIANSFRVIGTYLGIKTEFIISSTLDKDCSLKGQDKVLAICKLLNATEYYNAIGGQELYSFEDFAKEGIALKFLEMDSIIYDQFGGEFQPNLSILDALMFNSREICKSYLDSYHLL